MSENRQHIIEKIQKLLRLADNNTNEAECISAALKAQKLIADYNIEDHELQEGHESETIETLQSSYYVGHKWRYVLANIIAENFRCKAYTEYKHKDKRWVQGYQYCQCFIGYKSDATAALLVYNKLVEVGEACAKNMCQQMKQKYGTSQGVKNTFLVGFCYGVKTELEKQSQALMLVVPQIVLAAYKAKGLEIGAAIDLYDSSIDCTPEGKIAGRDAVRSSRLDSPQIDYMLA